MILENLSLKNSFNVLGLDSSLILFNASKITIDESSEFLIVSTYSLFNTYSPL
jgi:hypothetical protein